MNLFALKRIVVRFTDFVVQLDGHILIHTCSYVQIYMRMMKRIRLHMFRNVSAVIDYIISVGTRRCVCLIVRCMGIGH